jgi:hypothetical protein
MEKVKGSGFMVEGLALVVILKRVSAFLYIAEYAE